MSFVKNVSWMGMGTLVSIVVSVVSVPLILKIFSIQETSYFLWLWTLIGIMNLADMGASRGVSKYISSGCNRNRILLYAFSYVSIVFIFLLIAFVISSLVLNSLPWEKLPGFVKIDSLLIVLLSFLTFPLSGYIEGKGNFQYIAIIKNICNICSYALPIFYFYCNFEFEVIIYLSVVFSRALLFLLLCFFCFSHKKNDSKKNDAIEYIEQTTFSKFISFCLSVGLASTLGIIFLYWDRYLAISVLNNEKAVYYIAFSELIVKGYAIPGIITGVVFQYFSSGSYVKNKAWMSKIMRPRHFIAVAMIVSLITLFIYYLCQYYINQVLFGGKDVSDLNIVMYVMIYFSVLNCFSMIATTIGQALNNHKKILFYQVAFLPVFTIFSYVFSVNGYFIIGLILWYIRVPFVLLLTLKLNFLKFKNTHEI